MVLFVVLTLIVAYLSTASLIKITLERGYDYDKVIWNGDCSKINAIHVAFENEKICECKKLINVNGIKSELFGAAYPDKNGFIKCSYDYRETGANMFLTHAFRSPINTVSDTLFGEGLHLSENRYHHSSQYNLNTNISIKEFRLYTFSREKPFINIKNTMFQWRNYRKGSRQSYDLKMTNRVTRHFRGKIMQILFERTELEVNETTSYGFAVVKFVGGASYDLKIPALQEVTLQESNEECKYEIAAFVLMGITGLLIFITIALVVKARRRPENRKKAASVAVGKKDEHGHSRKKDSHDKTVTNNNQLSFQDYRNLNQVKTNSYKTLKLGATANGNVRSDNVRKLDHVYATYGPGNGAQNMESNVHVVGSEYYNDCY